MSGRVVLDTSVLSGGVDLLTSHLSAIIALILGAIVMALRCSLCLLPPNCMSNQKKFKKLHGKSALVELIVLNALLSRQNLDITFGHDAVICIFCQRMLLKVQRIQNELNTAISAAYEKINRLAGEFIARFLI